MQNILVTGGAGFIGSNLCSELVKSDYNVTVLDNLSEQIHGSNAEVTSSLYLSIKDKVRFIRGSVNDKVIFAEALLNQDIVVHLAAETGTGQSMYQIDRYVNVNIGGTGILLDLLANSKHNVKKVIVASSRSIYGEGKYLTSENVSVYPKNRNCEFMDRGDFAVRYLGSSDLKLVATDEESKIHPSSLYGITKQNQEQMIMTICPAFGIAATSFRYQNVYGPGQSLANPYTGILSIFSTLIKNGRDIDVFEDGKESRDFVFIDDVVNATIAGIESNQADNEIFNVGSGVPTDVITVAETLKKCYNSSNKINVTGNYRIGDIRHNYADLKKAKTLLGFKPAMPFDQGIRLFTEWVNQQVIGENKYDDSIIEMKQKGLLK